MARAQITYMKTFASLHRFWRWTIILVATWVFVIWIGIPTFHRTEPVGQSVANFIHPTDVNCYSDAAARPRPIFVCLSQSRWRWEKQEPYSEWAARHGFPKD